MANRKNTSWAVCGNLAAEPSQNNPKRSQLEGERSNAPPPSLDRLALLENQVQHLAQLLTGFLNQQQVPYSPLGERRENASPSKQESHHSQVES